MPLGERLKEKYFFSVAPPQPAKDGRPSVSETLKNVLAKVSGDTIIGTNFLVTFCVLSSGSGSQVIGEGIVATTLIDMCRMGMLIWRESLLCMRCFSRALRYTLTTGALIRR